ncbi:Stk1 family PASTA domain-containing Ser/Thr kinase [Nocardioides ginsengisoli]|uniref:non-specific serine/threonine protein kinase n=1 Tax=Nocardioides ginsengisoli TaxID=363868 RepID=A0ABW3W9E7_9ACTN
MHDDQRARGETAARSGDPSRRTEDHQFGRLLDGRYRIGTRIARGGMASVYEAIDTRLDRTVAVKIMHPGLGDGTTQQDDSFARRFVSEAKAAARLSHPHVVAVYDQGRDDADGTIYLVMEFVPGHTLRDTIGKEAPLSPEKALALLDPILSALASAHRAGLIHRDVKPENVLIADDGRIKVADFGLAKAVSADTQHTATNGVLIGTVSYLAPELVVEQRADARADVYAAGVILFELLTGTKPHTGETPIAVAYRHVHHDVPAPSSLVPGIPAYVDALVARATTRDPSLRPADAAVLLHQVHRVAQALRDGVRDDPELVADLLPSGRVAAPESPEVEDDTTPEPVSTLWAAGDREPTSVIRSQQLPPPTPVGPRAPRPPRPERPRRSRRGLVWVVVLALLVAIAGTGGWWLGWGRYTSTPSVIGLTSAAAQAKVDHAGLAVRTGDPVYSETVEKGKVISTDPGPGARILPGGEVTIVVSLGPERYDVPQVAHLTLDAARAALAAVKFETGQVSEKWSDTVPAGQVIGSSPSYGTPESKNLPVGTVVTLVVSKGKKPIKITSWVGKDAKRAEKVLEKRGLKVEIKETYDDVVPEGRVISQDPETGTLYKGDTLNLVVSKGKPFVTVPGIRLKDTQDAVALLEGLGLKVRTEHASIYLTGGTAWSTDPGAGARVRKGSTIVLYIV